eukprot:5085908-Amphidinium_carterae.1
MKFLWGVEFCWTYVAADPQAAGEVPPPGVLSCATSADPRTSPLLHPQGSAANSRPNKLGDLDFNSLLEIG